MDIGKLVLSQANNIGEVEKIKEIVEKLPKNYNPFLEISKDDKIGIIGFEDGTMLISPLMSDCYHGAIAFPEEATNCMAINDGAFSLESVAIGAKFKFKGNDYKIYRTSEKHFNP